MKKIVEEWRWIVGYEGMYQISNIGRVKSLKFGKEKILKNRLNSVGYLFISLCKDGKQKQILIHQLVAQAFLNHVIDKYTMVVNHIDGNKLNNRIDNLEVVTNRDNCSSSKCFRKNQYTFTSKYDNVCWNKKLNKWQSYILYNNIHYYLGLFKIEEDARDSSVLALSHIINGTFLVYYYELINKLKNKLNNNNKIKILQYNKIGEFIREWDSSTEAGKELNINRSNIGQCCK